MSFTRFSGRVAAVTGAGSGMGRALALSLASAGAKVAISDVSRQSLDETAALIAQASPAQADQAKLHSSILDVADRDAVFRWADTVATHFGQVNYVFNNAGVSVSADVAQLTQADFEWLMNINFWGVVNGTQAFLPHLQAATEGHIANTASVFGIIAVPTQAAYNASKFAVRGFTEALRQELKDSHVGASCVCPGGVKTNIVTQSRYIPSDNTAPTKETLAARFEELAGLTASEAAEIILRGVLRNKARILVGKDARLIALINQLLPVSYPRLLERVMRITED